MKVAKYSTAAQTPVLHIRLNPEDMLGCIDVLKSVEAATAGMSMNQAVRAALQVMLNTLRQQGTIPNRAGFEYNEMIAPFSQVTQVRKLQTLAINTNMELARVQNDLPASPLSMSTMHAIIEDSPAVKRQKGKLLSRIMELDGKKSIDPLNFGTEEEQELVRIQREYDVLIGVGTS